jgi:hypothetical protein
MSTMEIGREGLTLVTYADGSKAVIHFEDEETLFKVPASMNPGDNPSTLEITVLLDVAELLKVSSERSYLNGHAAGAGSVRKQFHGLLGIDRLTDALEAIVALKI